MADPLDPPERQVRKQRIDPRLKALGWGIVPYSPALLLGGLDCVAIEEYPTNDSPADYAHVVLRLNPPPVPMIRVTLD
jgi:hypothetical protein